MLRLAVLLGLSASPALAMLSPFYDSAEKITAILQDAAVADALRQAPIGAISNTGSFPDGADEWTVRTQECDLVLKLIAKPAGMPGKATYSIAIATPCP
jgi:hypothetical protein